MVDETMKSVKKQFAGTLMAVGAATVILSLVVGYFGASRALARPGIEANIKKIEDAAAVAGEFAELDKKFALKDHPHDFPVPPVLDLSTLVPIGSIIAWHKNGEGVPGDDVGSGRNWMECNGDKVTDPESPLKGRFIPDLNGAKSRRSAGYPTDWFHGQRLFLRGHTVSGHFEKDAFQGHGHEFSYKNDAPVKGPSGVPHGPASGTTLSSNIVRDPVSLGHGDVRVETETRPVNMSVVWIMRVK